MANLFNQLTPDQQKETKDWFQNTFKDNGKEPSQKEISDKIGDTYTVNFK